MNVKRINLNMNEDLVTKIDVYAKLMGISRSAAMNVLISTQLQQQEALGTFKSMVQMVEEDKLNRTNLPS